MKKLFFLFLLLNSVFGTLCAQQTCIEVTARENDSDVLRKLTEAVGEWYVGDVENLKVSGTINGYDIMVFRNKMPELTRLDLSEARIVYNSYEYYKGYHTENDVLGDYAFYNMSHLVEVKLPQGITAIGLRAFSGCSGLKEIVIPSGLQSIGSEAFKYCSSLTSVEFPSGLQSIGTSAFYDCKLSEVSIPASVKSVGSSAFVGNYLEDVYVYSMEPLKIGQSTFSSYTYSHATLYVPEMSEYLYYWDTQWSQFQYMTTHNVPYEYFYMESDDLEIGEYAWRVEGVTDEETGETKNTDADLYAGSGLIVEGNESQDFGNVNLHSDGSSNSASMIGGNSKTTESGANINIDNLTICITVDANRWYFFSFPFDIEYANISSPGLFVWRHYDGEQRAQNGSGGWSNHTGKLLRGQGYIFQCSKSGTLKLTVPKASVDGRDFMAELAAYGSGNRQDVNWNFVGNPFCSYYRLCDVQYESPVTIWTGSTYTAYSPLDDDITLYPFQAFFVQKPEGVDGVGFLAECRETRNQMLARQNAGNVRGQQPSPAKGVRHLVNIEVSDGVGTDATRVVFNEQSQAEYEIGRDAAKFISTEAPQIYTVDGDGTRYAINERPMDDGCVVLGFNAQHDGEYTIRATRADCDIVLTDMATGQKHSLKDGYTFTSEAGVYTNRFRLSVNGGVATQIDSAAAPQADTKMYNIDGTRAAAGEGLRVVKQGENVRKVMTK